ncbi:MAG: hypothetical protein AAFN80_08165 [Pseudomonadota bacterium]
MINLNWKPAPRHKLWKHKSFLMPSEILTIDTPISLLAFQTKQHTAFSECAQIRTFYQGAQHLGSKFDEDDVHFLCFGTINLMQFLSDNDVPVLSLEQTYCVAENKSPALLPSFTQDLVLNAVTDAAMISLGQHGFRFLLATSRDFRAMVFAAAAEGIAQATHGLDQSNIREADAFEASASDAFWHSQRRPSELHKMSVQWLLQQQKGKPQ